MRVAFARGRVVACLLHRWVTRAVYVASISVVLAVLFSARTYDDPFLTFRYAANLARGAGFVYNAGERVLSTTTPLYTLLLAIFGRFTTDLPLVANLIGIAFIAIGALCLYEWTAQGQFRQPIAGWVVLVGYPICGLLLNTLGSEMPLYIALCLGALLAYRNGKSIQCAIYAALATLTRPDGILIAFLICAHWAYSQQLWRLPNLKWRHIIAVRAVALYVLGVGSWVIVAWAYFGSPIPATLAAKQAQGALAASTRFISGLSVIWYSYFPGFYGWLVLGCALMGCLIVLLYKRQLLLLFSWTALYVLAYGLLGVSRYFWYYAPLFPGVVIAVGLVVQAAVNRARQGGLMRVVAVVLVICLAAGQLMQLISLYRHDDPRMPVYRTVGDWLRTHTPSTATVGALEVGAIGYYSERQMVDFAGLLQPAVARALKDTGSYDGAAVWAFQHFQVDYLVLQDGSLPVLKALSHQSGCQSVQEFSPAIGDQAPVWRVYRCAKQ